MKVGLLVAFAGRNCGGPEIMDREFPRAVSRLAPDNEYHLFCLDRRAREVVGLEQENIIYHMLRPSLRPISLSMSLPWAISRVRPDVFYAMVIPPPYCPMDLIMNMPCSTTVVHPEFYPPMIRMRLQFLLHRGIRVARQVVCVSQHVRDVVRDAFGVPEERLPIINPGLNESFRLIGADEKREMLRERHGIDYPYFLFSGRWEPRKNVPRTLEAFALFKRRTRTEHKLVFSGERTWGRRDAEETIARLRLESDIVDLGKTPVGELPYLYGGADGVLFASLWEGFGMPIIEAQACGTPVITSNLAAMPETAGGAALLVDPYSVEEIAAAIQRIAEDRELRVELRSKGLKRTPLFTWENTARKTLDLFRATADQESSCRKYAIAQE